MRRALHKGGGPKRHPRWLRVDGPGASCYLASRAEKAFAPGVNREEVYGAEATLGLTLEEFIAVAITGVQQVAPDIGL